MTQAVENVIGLLLNMLGVIGLFRFGMPFEVRDGGVTHLVTEQINADAIRRQKLFDVIGWLSLAAIIVGTGFQIWAALHP